MPHTFKLTLPWPPSLNAAYIPVNSRIVPSKAARAYVKATNDQVTLQQVPRHRLSGKLRVEIAVRCPNEGKHDLDNLPKVVLDSLRKAGVILDDSYIDELFLWRGATLKGGELRLTLSEIEGRATHSGELFAKPINGGAHP